MTGRRPSRPPAGGLTVPFASPPSPADRASPGVSEQLVSASAGGSRITADAEVRRTAVLSGLQLRTAYHFRAVLEVGGRTYRGRDRVQRTFGRALYPEVTLKARRRTATSTTYVGEVGPTDTYDAPGACRGTVAVDVYTLQGADLLRRSTKLRADCSYSITIPFGARQRARYGRKGSVLVQARFLGNRAIASAGSKADKP